MLKVGTFPLEGERELVNKEAVTRVVLADDHDVVRQGLKRLLDRAPEIEVVGEARDGLAAIESVYKLQPDVLLLDIEMPLLDGVEVARRLQESGTGVRILVLSAYDDREYILSLLDIGVSGYLVKGEAPGKIVEAIRGVAQGQKGWVSPKIKQKLAKMDDFSYKQNTLTHLELEILRALAAGWKDHFIIEQLDISEAEFLSALSRLIQKLGVETREEAVEQSIREGWISKTGE